MNSDIIRGDLFFTGSVHDSNLRKLKVVGFMRDRTIAVCMVARGPNGQFYNSKETVQVLVSRLKLPYRYRRSLRAKSVKNARG